MRYWASRGYNMKYYLQNVSIFPTKYLTIMLVSFLVILEQDELSSDMLYFIIEKDKYFIKAMDIIKPGVLHSYIK